MIKISRKINQLVLKRQKNIKKNIFSQLEKYDKDLLSYLITNFPKESKNIRDLKLDDSNFVAFEKVFKSIFPGYRCFNKELYLKQNPDISVALNKGLIKSAEQHFILFGLKEVIVGNRSIPFRYESDLVSEEFLHSYFDLDSYEKSLEEAGISFDIDLYDHFLQKGQFLLNQGRIRYNKLGSYFRLESYLKLNKDINLSILMGEFKSPLEHYLKYGANEINLGKRAYLEDVRYYQYNSPIRTNKIDNYIENFKFKPLISVVIPVFNVDPKWLKLAVLSIVNQWYENWEICICDDASSNAETIDYLKELEKRDNRISIKYLDKNSNISQASNIALSIAKGDFIALMDNDDEITPDAFYEAVTVLQDRSINFIYSDEDKIELTGEFSEPHFKPDYSPEMLLSHNYISHLTIIKRDLFDRCGKWRVGYEGAQDYDLYLRMSELEDFNPYHIPKVLYHWRKIPGSTAVEFGEKSYANKAGLRSLKSAVERRGIPASVDYGLSLGTYRVNYTLPDTPLVSIVIPFKNKPELLIKCLNSIFDNSSYTNFEVVCVDNQSDNIEIEFIKKKYQHHYKNVHFINYNFPFNYSAINNYAVNNYCRGKYIVLMNNDIEILEPNWVQNMLSFAQLTEVGAVGAKLFFPNNTIQHAGIIVVPKTPHGLMTAFQGLPANSPGYFARLNCVCNYSAVTAALLMVSKNKYQEVGGLDENLAVAYNDVDFCLQLLSRGYRNIYTPYVTALHHESISRGYEDSVHKLDRLGREKEKLRQKHNKLFQQKDTFFNPNLDNYSPHFSLAKAVTVDSKDVAPRTFTDEIISVNTFGEISRDRYCIFSHFDRDNIIDDYVLELIKSLSLRYKIIFVTTCELIETSQLQKLNKYIDTAIVKKNYGYDFGAWKTGLDFIQSSESLENIKEILFINDSLYGPINSFDYLYQLIDSERYDVVGVADSYEIDYHLQSYCISYNNSALKSRVFNDFWAELNIYPDKRDLIVNNEVGLTKKLLKSDLSIGSLVKSDVFGYVNNVQYNWDRIILESHFPFVKIELLRDNPLNIDISNYKNIIGSHNPELLKIIESHLSRVKR